MRNTINRIGYLLLALCIALVVADLSTVEGFFSSDPISSPIECPDTSAQAEHSHADCTGDEIFAKNSKAQPGLSMDLIGMLPEVSDPLTSHYFPSIWQPPRSV